MIDLDKLDEYTRKRVESDAAESPRKKNATNKFLECFYLLKVCRADEFFSNPELYDNVITFIESTCGRNKETRQEISIIKQIKEENCK